MGNVAVRVDYEAVGDLLSISSGVESSGGAVPVTIEPDVDSFSSKDGKCVAVYFYDAALIFMPHLTANEQTVSFSHKELRGSYCRVTDTLTFGNRTLAKNSGEMAEGLTAHYDEKGKVAGVTLERAAELLLPRLQEWRPRTDAEMTEIQRRMDENLARIRERKASGS